MPGDVQGTKRTYGVAATVVMTVGGVAFAVGVATGNLFLELVAPLVATSLAVCAFSGAIVHRPRAVLTVFGDEEQAKSDRYVRFFRVGGVLGVVLALLCLALGGYLFVLVSELPGA